MTKASLVTTAAVGLIAASSASAAVIGFEDVATGSYNGSSSGATDFTAATSDGTDFGFRTTRNGSATGGGNNKATTIVNGGNPGHATRVEDFGDQLRFERSDGGSFDLDSLDGQAGFSNSNGFDADVSGVANGSVVGTTTISTDNGNYDTFTFGSDFEGLDLVTIDFSGGDSGRYAQIDNVNVSTIPEPASLALLGVGALAMLPSRRRRR